MEEAEEDNLNGKPTPPDWASKATARMKQLNINQSALAEPFHVKDRSAVGHYFTGRRPLKLWQAKVLAKILKYDSLDPLFWNTQDELDLVDRKTPHLLRYDQLKEWSKTGKIPPGAATTNHPMALLALEKTDKPCVVVQIKTDSMKEYAPISDFVLVYRTKKMDPGQIGFFLYKNHVVFGQYRKEGPVEKIHYTNWDDQVLGEGDEHLARVKYSFRDGPTSSIADT